MHPAFSSIQFGPFASAYHSQSTSAEFKLAFSKFLEQHLLPQVEHPFDSTSGTLLASYDDEKYCGPNSLVRDIYNFDFSFHRKSGDDSIKIELVFNARDQSFSTRRNKPFYLWTVSRRERYQEQGQRIEALCQRIAKQEPVNAVCPICSTSLHVHDSPTLFDVRCPNRCFNYNYHRDPVDGQFLHGHFFRGDPVDA
ncbi:hypothetical protein [Undibacterium pigrum]|uniref:Uncharacterized protein n=1 Tax=Undibacterium pigrum TaxID=401470 RepID=A0A318ITK2_9BURK|nr:hypothetical protein [Undibacterium pigrum]PXX38524.1 hypothetical protein DFR42_11236 [Undibacterium pigrum]